MLGSDTLRFGVNPVAPPRSAADRLDDPPATRSEAARSGRTHRMIMALPEDGAVVIVHAPCAIGIFRDAIRQLRGDAVADATRVIAAPTPADERRVTGCLSLPVFRDHFVDEQREHARALMKVWRS